MAKILVAEDEAVLRSQIMRALMADGHDAVGTADGGEALEVLARENGGFDLLLTDIKMPVMDGIALALVVARDYPRPVILLMTGYADQRERAHGLEALIAGVLTKPFVLADLREAIAQAMRRRSDRDLAPTGDVA
jgi:two-component system, cell cycle response regulator CpdR